jgi:hypothetical protein
MDPPGPFRFHTELRLVALTGERATTLEELLELLRHVPGSSIFYHTHHEFLVHHFERPNFRNDFALWVEEALQEDELSEKLVAVDLLDHTTILSLREALIHQIESHIETNRAYGRRCPPGDEFHFCRAKSFVLPSGLQANDPAEFFRMLSRISNNSVSFHFLEARLRLGRPSNDFSDWLEAQGETSLAESIQRLNPYEVTLDELRAQIARLGEARFKDARFGESRDDPA